MADFAAFRGTTYDTGRIEPGDVIAPPYDVVGPLERAGLAARSPYNSILVELPEDPAGGDRYEHAASLWASWHDTGVVTVASVPTYYVYRMTFEEEDGTTRATTGVIGALRLDPGHTGAVLPHEQTISKDKHDRLSLLRATGTNFSPIWGLSLSEGLGELCARAVGTLPADVKARDDAGVLHESWAVSDRAAIEQISSAVAATPVLIADGHHRYETACSYLAEQPDRPGADAVLCLMVELSRDELAVQAIHRLVSGVAADALRSHLEASFELLPGPDDRFGLRDEMVSKGALGLVDASGSFLLRPRPSLLEAADDDLDSSRLATALSGLDGVEVGYQHGVVEVTAAVAEGRATAAVLLRPVSVDQIARTAHGGKRMPPKSTFFYPKPRTGIVFRELDAG